MTDVTKKILIVEDEETIIAPLTTALEQAGYTVSRAKNGVEGLQMARAQHPDMMLLDLKMPQMNGLEMIAELRKDEWGKSAQVIILTNSSDVSTVQEAMAQGAFFYMVKSESSMADIVAMVTSKIGK